MQTFAWAVLALVFLDELLAVAAAGVWGASVAAVLSVAMPLVVVGVWFLFASPKARHGGPLLRPVMKTLVFVLASAGLWASGHAVAGALLLVFSFVVNGLAQLPPVRAVVRET